MRSLDEPKSNGQRLYEALKKIRKYSMGARPLPNLRHSEMMMMHSILYCSRQLTETGKCPTANSVIDRRCPPDDQVRSTQGVTISELSSFTQMTSSAVSQTVKSLEEKGLIERSISPRDRRHVFINVSEKGHQIFHQVEQSFKDYLVTITEALGEEDTNQLITLLEKLVDILPPLQNNQ